MTLDEARAPQCLVLEVISGSHAYGLATPESDTDIKGVFVQPTASFFGLERITQLNNETNDTVLYELGRFVELLAKGNPNLLEMLFTPPECVVFRHPLMERLSPQWFLSRRCFDSFARYAMTQIRKARGLNKKIVSPMPKDRPCALDFCHVLDGQGSVRLSEWLAARGLRQEQLGLVAIPHMRDVYGMYADSHASARYRGVVADQAAAEVRVSEVPKDVAPVGWMSFNKDGLKKYTKDWRAYWQWIEVRNEARYRQTEAHGQGYDAKNLMHTFRLLDLAAEIARDGRLTLRVADPSFLHRIRGGEFGYDWLLAEAERRLIEIEALFAKSELPAEPDLPAITGMLASLRRGFWMTTGQL
jgi:uncharacterized protein